MGRSDSQFSTRRLQAILVWTLAASALLASAALASRGRTVSASTAFPADTQRTAVVTCPRGTHATGGGFSATPLAAPGGLLESFTTNSNFAGRSKWSVTSRQFSGGDATVLTAKARCERRSDGRIAALLTGSATITPDTSGPPYDLIGQNLIFHCPPGTHEIAGGHAVDRPFDPNEVSNQFVATQSRRTHGTWTISGYLFGGPAATSPPAELTGTVPCERNGARKIRERSRAVPFGDDIRSTASARCPRRHHLVSGGFAFTPIVEGQAPPVPFVDRSVPASRRKWVVSAYDLSLFQPPPSAALTTYAYCRRNFPRRRRARPAAIAADQPAGQGWVEVRPAPTLSLTP